ncbi:MAG: protein kinase [Methylococcales bacterium]|nr:protein kinase [Methylococcales bacterium]
MEEDYKNSLPSGHKLYEYCIESVLGAGAFGITYKALDVNLSQYVAIKEYLPNNCAFRQGDTTVVAKSSHDQETYQWGLTRFGDEGKHLAKFKHPNIVRILRYFIANDTAYLVMEYENGETLEEYLKRLGRCLTESEALAIFKPILEGLQAVHDGNLLHRDIKPSNIFLRYSGSPVLIDFGAARYDLSGKSCLMSEILTPGYAPFEQNTSEGKNQGSWSDVYAVGASLYRCITGKRPVDANLRAAALVEETPDPYVKVTESLAGRYSRSFLEAVDAALIFRPQKRPQTIQAFQSLLFDTPQPSSKAMLSPLPISSTDDLLDDTVINTRSSHPSTLTPDSFPLKKSKFKRLGVFFLITFIILLIFGGIGTQLYLDYMDEKKLAAINEQKMIKQQQRQKIAQEKETKKIAEQQHLKAAENILLNGKQEQQKIVMTELEPLAITNADAMRLLGLGYYWGMGVTIDYRLSCQWYKKSADAGNKEAKVFYDKSTKCN